MAVWVRLKSQFDWQRGMRFMKSFPPGDHYMTEDQAVAAEKAGGERLAEKPASKKTDKTGQTVEARDAN